MSFFAVAFFIAQKAQFCRRIARPFALFLRSFVLFSFLRSVSSLLPLEYQLNAPGCVARNSEVKQCTESNSSIRFFLYLVSVVAIFFICYAPHHTQRLMYAYGSHMGWSNELRSFNEQLFYIGGTFLRSRRAEQRSRLLTNAPTSGQSTAFLGLASERLSLTSFRIGKFG